MSIKKFLNPKNDVAFHRIFGQERNKDILIYFINSILEFTGEDIIKDVSFLSPIQTPEIASKKVSIVDILCRSEKGEQIIVEMQVSPQSGFEKRAQYYAAKAYSRQLNAGKGESSQYQDLKAVIFIAICDTIIFPEKEHYKSDHVILDKETYAHDLQYFSFTFIELPKFKLEKITASSSIIEKWCFFFKHAEAMPDDVLREIVASDAVIKRAYEEVNSFNWTEDELRHYDDEEMRIMDWRAVESYREQMAKKLSEQKLAEGLAKGLSQGLSQGRAEGIEEGKTAERQSIAKAMLAQNIDMGIITKITGIDSNELKKL